MLEPFGIRPAIEPGVIKTKFNNSTVVAKKFHPNSSYASLMSDRENGIMRLIKNESTPHYVTDVVIDAITTKNLKLRYSAGKNIEG